MFLLGQPMISVASIETLLSTHSVWTCPSNKKAWLRKMSNDKAEGARNEVKRLLSASVIREVTYPEWLTNTVMVKKANGKWRMCIDFTDLKKACPKDEFPLPRIDSLLYQQLLQSS
jgi:hypothetical protein